MSSSASSSSSSPPLSRVVLGVVVPAAGAGLELDRIVTWLSDHLAMPVEKCEAASYEALAADVSASRVDIAWLPPIVLVRLGDVVTPIGSIVRGSPVDSKASKARGAYEAAIIVKASSKIRTINALHGTRAGWVDRWSAAGYVLPRVKLALLGVDPKTLFKSETFYGSHRAAIKALLEGTCDVTGTHAQADENGDVTHGGWSDIEGGEDVRVLATFGAIPPDVLAVRTAIVDRVRDKALAAFKAACADESIRPSIRQVFGGEELSEGVAPGYDSLKKAIEMATARGLFSDST